MVRRASRPWRFWGALAGLLTLVAVLAGAPGGGPADSTESVGIPVSASIVAVLIGLLAMWLAYKGLQEQRRHETELAAAAARDAVLSDRLAIAGDLHDILSHGLGAITVRARAGERIAPSQPEEASAALADIAELSASATADLRAFLAVLHDTQAPAPTAPTAGLADLPTLVDQARDDGLTVTASGLETRASAAGAGLAAYHVAREALANSLRHAGPCAVSLRVAKEDGSLQVTVDDIGTTPGWAPNPGAGHGLALLATRVAAAGGTLTHGPTGAGYRVHATIPDVPEVRTGPDHPGSHSTDVLRRHSGGPEEQP